MRTFTFITLSIFCIILTYFYDSNIFPARLRLVTEHVYMCLYLYISKYIFHSRLKLKE